MSSIFIFCCIYLSTIIYATPITKNDDVKFIDLFEKNVTKCPSLQKSFSLNDTINNMNCNSMLLDKVPKSLDTINVNEYRCVGLLIAETQLCNSLLKTEYKNLPENASDFKANIDKIQKQSPDLFCKKLSNITLFNESLSTLYSPWAIQLNKNLKSSNCKIFCSDLFLKDITNEICSMFYFMFNHIESINKIKIIEQDDNKANNKDESTPSNNNNQIISKIPNNLLPDEISPVNNKNSAIVSQNQNVIKTSNEPSNISNNDQSKKQLNQLVEDNSNVKVKENFPSSNTLEPHLTVSPVQNINNNNNNSSTITTSLNANTSTTAKLLEPKQESDVPVEQENSAIEKIYEDIKLDDKPNPSKESDNNQGVNVMNSEQTTSTQSNNDYNDEFEMDNVENVKQDDQEIDNSRSHSTINKQTIENYQDMEESNFFSYFMFFSVLFTVGYVVYHNKQKIMALMLEGRRDRNSRRRPNTSSYRKLNSNLEEAVTSKCSATASHIIY